MRRYSSVSKHSGKTVPELLALGSNIIAILSSEAGSKYPVSPSIVSSLTGADLALNTAENAQIAAMIAAKSRTAEKLVFKEDVASQIATIEAVVAADPSVTDAELVALGFSPRRGGGSRPKLPSPVTGLTVTPDALGGVVLRWTRGDSASRTTVSYIVEHSEDGGASWNLLDTTKRVSISASGFAPGVAAWFRVTATAAAGRATPSAPASIYAPVPAVELKLAA